ncbi:MAG: hypothetical protein FJ087_14805, partial [Deltaproteobacteria bacterium]|nr:hypothetical protein [Deltaproteobacteria bacterium]
PPGGVVVGGGGPVRFTGGVAKGVSLRIEGAFGETRIWAREVVTGVIGVSDAIRLRNPSISQVQGSEVCSPMEDEFVVIDSGALVVTNVTTNGMNVVDVSDLDEKGRPAPGSSVFVYSFSRPMSLPSCVEDEEADTLACSQHSLVPVQVCDRVRRVSGGVSAFNGFTELKFPSWELVEWDPSEGPCPVPEPFDLTGLACADLYGAGPLRYEGALVRVRNVEVDCDDGEACYQDAKYVRYGEWWINLKGGSCKTGKVYVVSHIAAPDFDPFLPENARISSITGTLKPLYFSPDSEDKCKMGGDFTWIVEPRCPDDIVVSGEPRPVRESCLPR